LYSAATLDISILSVSEIMSEPVFDSPSGNSGREVIEDNPETYSSQDMERLYLLKKIPSSQI
jgi:hypothetical protein